MGKRNKLYFYPNHKMVSETTVFTLMILLSLKMTFQELQVNKKYITQYSTCSKI